MKDLKELKKERQKLVQAMNGFHEDITELNMEVGRLKAKMAEDFNLKPVSLWDRFVSFFKSGS